jgi:radical SAM protein with 4Fe4S-binding SPASM domain
MIGVSKLYCSTVEPSDPLRYQRRSEALPSHLLQFSEDKKPVIVWNITRACNLSCHHCYASATPGPADDELTFPESLGLISDLTAYGVPVILFSGGEPLVHPRLFELVEAAIKGGARAVLSTNGLLLNEPKARKFKQLGLSYVGISLDGLCGPHERLRGLKGSFQGALKAVKTAREAGLKVGLRLTMTKSNRLDLDALFDLLIEQQVPRVCFYHLVDRGDNPALSAELLTHQETREALDTICRRTRELHDLGQPTEVLTVDNQADGPYLYLKLLEEGRLREAENALELLKMNGGAGSGHGIGAISWNGDVHPDQFWRGVILGSVRNHNFRDIWHDPENSFLAALKNKKKHLKGRCRQCQYLEVCGGGLRARAAFVTGDPWNPDPACFLTDEEIALPKSHERPSATVETTRLTVLGSGLAAAQ